MLTAITLAALIAGQTPPAQTQSQEPAAVEDIVIDGSSLIDRSRGFVSEVAAPTANRNLATWSGTLCIGAANMGAVHGQAMVDRVSDVARVLGLHAGQPGCDPNVIIIAAADAGEVAAELVERRQRVFMPGWTGASQGRSELDAFIQTDRPVRWWHISIPVDAATGEAAVRLPGEGPRVVNKRMGASRLRSPLRDDMRKVFIIIDVDDVANVTFDQLTDYVAFLVMAQTDPEADTSGFDTILNLFSGAPQPGLTDWDMAYLQALYRTDPTLSMPNRHGSNVGHALARDIGRQIRQDEREAQPEPDAAPDQ